jgi:hypothetical protein
MNAEDKPLIERLWESDAASALTNEAARKIEKMAYALHRCRQQYLAAIENTETSLRLSTSTYSSRMEDSIRLQMCRVGIAEIDDALDGLSLSRKDK